MNTVQIDELTYESLIGSLDSYSMGYNAAITSHFDDMLTPLGHINTKGLEEFNTDYVKGFIDGVLEEFPHAKVEETEETILN